MYEILLLYTSLKRWLIIWFHIVFSNTHNELFVFNIFPINYCVEIKTCVKIFTYTDLFLY